MLHSNHFRMLVSGIFLLLTASSVAGTKDNASTPKFDSIRVDALDADAWNGVVFAARHSGSPPTLPSDSDRSARPSSMDRRSSMLFGKSGLMLRMGRTVACRGRFPRAMR
jgi:hypothetical protein